MVPKEAPEPAVSLAEVICKVARITFGRANLVEAKLVDMSHEEDVFWSDLIRG